MRVLCGILGVWCLPGALAGGLALAQARPVLGVTRGAGAEQCPDTAALRSRIEQLRGRPEAGANSAYQVHFARESDGFSAAIRTGTQAGSARVLRDRGQTCAALEQATAVTLALLLDSDARESTRPAPSIAEIAPPASSVQPAPHRAAVDDGAGRDDGDAPGAAASGASRPRVMLALGGGGLLGVLRPIAPALAGDLGVGVSRLRASVGALFVPEQTIALGPGHVRESLLSAVARTCIAAARGATLRFELCSGVYLGRLSVAAESYTRNDEIAKLWLALPFELALSSESAPLGWELGASALVPLPRRDFAIDDVGVAYASLPVAVLISLRATGSWLP